MTEQVTARHVADLASKARRAQRLDKDQDRARALATEASTLLDRMEGTTKERADVHAAVAAVWRDLDEAERCEAMIVEAIRLEAQVEPSRPAILGTHELFYADFLRRRQRFAEAADHATRGIAIYERSDETNPRELAELRAIVDAIVSAARAHPPA